MKDQMERLMIEGVKVIFKNFRGEKGPYNKNGDRTFSLLITDEGLAQKLLSLGWSLKSLDTQDDLPPAYHLPVKINFEGRTPPRVYSVKSNGKLLLDESTVAMLDYQPILEVDVVLNPYFWSVNGDTGVKAYLQTMYAIIDEKEIDLKYADIPES